MNKIFFNGCGKAVGRLPKIQFIRRFAAEKKKVERFMWCQTEYKAPKVILSNGHEMPLVGLGTWVGWTGHYSTIAQHRMEFQVTTQLEHLINLDFNAQTSVARMTSIVCTIGPSSQSVEILEKLIETGMNIARMNFSLGTHEYHAQSIQNVRQAVKNYSEKVGYHHPVGIALDTRGPEIRTGSIAGGDPIQTVKLNPGGTIKLTTNKDYMNKCTEDIVYVDYENLPRTINVGNRIFIDDGLISLVVRDISGDTVTCNIENKGTLGSKKGVNLPGIDNDLPNLSEKDKSDLLFGVEHEVDMIFASFIRNAGAINEIRAILGEKGKHIQVLAKIENQQGLLHLDEIISASDGILIARGDLGIEIEPEKVFLAQKSMIARCNMANKPVVCATQMLESMILNPRGTRAELSDIANAVLDGADCVMLSGETAKGSYPAECLSVMAKTCREAEAASWKKNMFEDMIHTIGTHTVEVNESIAIAAVEAAYKCKASLILVLSTKGKSAFLISKFFPNNIILMVTENEKVARCAHLYHGVFPVIYKRGAQQLNWTQHVDAQIKLGLDIAKQRNYIKAGDKIVYVLCLKEDSKFADSMRIDTFY